MTNANSTREPNAVVGAIVGGSSAVWVALSTLGNASAQVALLVVAALGVTVALAKCPSWRPTLTLGLALHALVLGAILYFAIHEALNVDIVHHVCVSNDVDSSVVLALGGAAVFTLARFLAQHSRFVAHLLRLASLAAFAGAFVMLAWTIPEMFRKPTPDRYIESLPVFAVLPPIKGEPSRVVEDKERLVYASVYHLERQIYTTRVYDLPLPGDLVAQRYCSSFRDDCALVINHAKSATVSTEPGLSRPPQATEASECNFRHVYADKNASIVIRADIAHGVLVADGTVRYSLSRADGLRSPLRD